jgi:ParB/RepB/Spo0J family partition protein
MYNFSRALLFKQGIFYCTKNLNKEVFCMAEKEKSPSTEEKKPTAPDKAQKQPQAEATPKESPAPDIKDAAGKQAAVKGKDEKSTPDKAQKHPQADKAAQSGKPPKTPKVPKGKQAAEVKSGGKPEQKQRKEPPRDATRPGKAEKIVYIDHAELHPFKDHPFKVRDDEAMKTLVDSVKERGVDQPAIVRPRESGGYELVAGHRRQHASQQAGLKNVPCVVRNMTDEEAVLAMTESNFNQRDQILASERAKALKMQLDAIKRQGARHTGVAQGDVGKRSNEIVAERNGMAVKQVQRYIALNNLVPEVMKLVDDKKIPFTAAVEMSYIKPKNQEYIAVAIDAQQSPPSLAQAQRMRELDGKGVLNGDVIDGIMLEEKKEEIKVIITGQELSKYFGADKSPREMKDTILKLLDEHKTKQPPEINKPEKKQAQEK